MASIAKHKITPYLWYDNNAEEAAEFYCSVFENAKITMRSPMLVEFELADLKFIALNGGPQFQFTEAVSFFVTCQTQEEVDYYWNRLTADGGEESMCGWLKDKFGLSWQIIPEALMRLMSDPDREKSERVQNAMLKMRKIIIADLEKAYRNA
jgi:predicted 3-demethylubiquinone-9 3-methyltransferase (glyoxalase superfamily)